MVGQQADGVAAEGVADPVQRPLLPAEQLDGGGEVPVGPVQVGHGEALQACRRGFADAAIVQGEYVEALARGVFGETPVEALGDARRAGHQQVAMGVARRVVAVGGQRIAVGRGQGQAFHPHRRCGMLSQRSHVGFRRRDGAERPGSTRRGASGL